MTRIDLHPEELLDAHRRGELDAAGRLRLDAHLERCSACAFDLALGDAFRDDAPGAGDEALLDAAVERAVSRGASSVGSRRGRAAFVAGAGALALAVAAAAALVLRGPPAPAPIHAEPAARRAPELPAPALSSRPPPQAESDPMPEVAPRREPRPRRDAPAAPPPARDAAGLFRLANAARRDGRIDEAQALYAELLERHPSSEEALTARISGGRLALDRGDAPRALAAFDAYLARAPGGPLAEEARAGRALALAAAGRRAEEREAWRELLSRHPLTAHRERAEGRLRELE